MRRCVGWSLVTAILVGILLLVPPRPAAADVSHALNPHFPKPVALAPNVAFWKQVYTEHGVGDFVLHDRDNLGVLYGVVRVAEKMNQARAEQLAKPEIERARDKYRNILLRLAEGATPEELGPEGRAVATMWGCPCAPDNLRRVAENIRVQQGLREKVDEGLRRARGLLPKIVSILQRHEVPIELAALPLVESTYNAAAYSKAGAAGLWQFIRSTGKQYSLVTRRRDHRRDPVRATEAAARLLRNNYEALGSWPLAIVAYNHGHAGVQAASSAVGSKAIEDIIARYDGPRFGFASRNFYAEFLAALDVVHPFLAGHGKTLAAKDRRRNVRQASIPVQPPPVAIVAPPAPPVAAPADVEQPTDAPVPPADASPIEHPIVPEASSETADLPAPPAAASVPVEAERPIEAAVPPVDQPLAEPGVVSEAIPTASVAAAPSTDTSSDSAATPLPPTAEASPHDTPPPELREAEPPEAVSP
jgi:hypothetical protein